MSVSKYKHQKGNVLFLILIAVALFAALSYAVTQSSRSGGDASKETNVINTASLTQYPNSIRTSVLRLIIAGHDPLDLQFNKPDQFEIATHTGFLQAVGVFHPQGGGAAYQRVPANLMASKTEADWKFNANFEIPLLGLSQSSSGSGNELIAFADGVTQTICARVNKELHNSDIIPEIASVTIDSNRSALNGVAIVAPTTETVLTNGGTPNWFDNKAFGCFKNGAGANDPYVFFYVLAER